MAAEPMSDAVDHFLSEGLGVAEGDAFLARLRRKHVLIGDGAIGTMLIAEGLEPGTCPDALTLERPETLAQIATRYLEAGADLLTTNTFGASPLRLSEFGLDELTEQINEKAVELVRGVAGGRAYVSASCGPSGKLLEPYGETSEAELRASFERQARALAGADVICVETMTDLSEAVAAITAMKTVHPRMPVMATMTFDPTPRGFFTIMGNSLEDVAAGLEDAGADVIGSNCGNGVDVMVEIARRLRAATSLPLLIQSNAGLPETDGGTIRYRESPEMFAERVPDLLEAGVSIIGGCCGTTPEHIQAIAAAVRRAT